MRREDDREPPEVLPDHEVISEATQLLRQMSFWSNRGAYAEGRYVAISVDPRWNDDCDTIRVALTCYAFGQQVDWRRLPIVARPASVQHPYVIAHLNARGQAMMRRLPPDDYDLYVPEHYERSATPLPFAVSAGHLAAATETPDRPDEPQIYDTPDGRLRATVRRTLDGTIIVAFETEEAALAGAVVYFAFMSEGGEVQHSASVTLTPVAEEPGLWEARWEAEIAFTEPYAFEFGLIPRDP